MTHIPDGGKDKRDNEERDSDSTEDAEERGTGSKSTEDTKERETGSESTEDGENGGQVASEGQGGETVKVREEQKEDESVSGERAQGTDEREHLSCPECGGNLIVDEERGETVCSECGLVVEENEIDRGPEWRAFDAREKDEKSRVGAPTTNMMHDKGLSTNIGWQDKDAYGRALSSSQRQKMQRLRTWNERFRTTSARDRNLKQALGEIERMASALGLPKNIRETASVIYRRALQENLLPGRSIEGVATAALYAAARQANAPRSLDEVANVSRVERSEIARTYRYVVRELSLEIKPADPESYLPRFVSELGLSEEVSLRAKDLLSSAKEAGITSGKSPVGLAAAAVYAGALLASERVTQDEVSEVANISEVTIRNRYHELLEAADVEGSQDQNPREV